VNLPASVHFAAMSHALHPRRSLTSLALAVAVALGVPALALAHAELATSTPADGTTVPATFEGPIVLTFSAALADGSKADLLGPDGAQVASAVVDGPGATMTITLEATLQASLAPGAYEVRWVSVGDDGDLERGTVAFTVAAAPATPSPTATAVTQTTAPASPSAAVQTTAPVPPTAAASPSASPPGDATGAGAADVILPIVVALIVVGAGAIYLLGRRNRPTLSR
jgi:methionine-rich copper-binding protein CopC